MSHPNTPSLFSQDNLDVYRVAVQALVRGESIARRIPRGHGNLADQLRRSLSSTVLGIAEAASRSGADRSARIRCSRGEAGEAGAALQVIALLGFAPVAECDGARALLGRVYAMLTKWGGLGE